jgi:hypothetical protein
VFVPIFWALIPGAEPNGARAPFPFFSGVPLQPRGDCPTVFGGADDERLQDMAAQWIT